MASRVQSFLLVAAAISCSLAVHCQALNSTDWHELHYVVYTTDLEEQVAPQTTLEHLKQLAAVYEPFSDEQTNGRKARVETLIEVANIVDEHCRRDKFIIYDQLIRYNSPYEVNIIPYLEHYSLEQFQHCRLHAIDRLYAEIRALSPQQKHDLELLDNFIAQASLDGLGRSERRKLERVEGPELELYILGVIDFVQFKLGDDALEFWDNFKDRFYGKAAYQETLEETVLQLCRDWYRATDPILLLIEMKVDIGFSDYEKSFLSYGLTCGRIDRYAETITRESFNLVRKMRAPRMLGAARNPAAAGCGGGGGVGRWVSGLFGKICPAKS